MEKNGFLSEIQTGVGSAYTQNGAISYASTGSIIVDQFGKCGTAMGRTIEEVFDDQSALWAENPLMAVQFPFYLRTISRKTRLFDGEVTELVQKGMGLKDEAYKRFLWLALYQPEAFYKNMWLIPIVGSWKDVWQIMMLDKNISLDRNKFFSLIEKGLQDEQNVDLVKKYMPRIRSSKKCTTESAKLGNALALDFANYKSLSPKLYRKLKVSGEAHNFQKQMCSGLYDSINFNAIPGKALSQLIKGEFFNRHNLVEKYLKWLKKQSTVKFNGYPYELMKGIKGNLKPIQKFTIDKQFDGLIEMGVKDNAGINGNVWCCLDTSGSMGMQLHNAKVTAYDVCIALGIYFSTLNKGAFHKNVIMFDDVSKVKQLSGTFTDMYNQIQRASTAWGSTNFQSVIDEIIRIRKSNPNIPLEDYPQTLLVVSDMQFNSAGDNNKTNRQVMGEELRKVFPQEFVNNMKFVWWNVNSKLGNDFPSNLNEGGDYFFSGYDGSIISILLGGNESVKTEKPSMEEIVYKALNQEVLTQISL